MDVNEFFEKVRALKCSQCGATDIEILDEKVGKCKHCGTTILFDQPKTEVINNINIVSDGLNIGLPIKYYSVNSEYEKKDFLKNTLTVLTEDLSTPVDVLNSQFSDVSVRNIIIVMYKAVAHISYSASLGYEETEKYYEYDSARQKNVEKTRRVIKYKSASGDASGENTVFLPDGEKADILSTKERFTGKNSAYHTDRYSVIEAESSYFDSHFSYVAEEVVSKAKEIEEVEGLPVILSNDGKEKAKEEILSDFAWQVESKLKGGEVKDVKDFNYTGYVENFTEIKCYSVPEYYVNYKYGEENYHSVSIPAGNRDIVYSSPSESKEVEETIEKKNFAPTFFATLFMLASIIVSFTVWNMTWCITVFVLAMIFFIVSKVNGKAVQKDLIDGRQKEKQSKLINVLSEKGLQGENNG